MRLAPGLHRIGDDLVACYLVVEGGAATLIDAALPGYHRDLLAELGAIGLGPRDLRAVIVTHGDPDHIGFAERLRVEHGVPILMHAADISRARGTEKAPPTPGRTRWRVGPALRFLATAIRRSGRMRRLTDVRAIADGDTLPLPGTPRIIGMPGHSPGSIAVHLPGVRALCVGDALTTRHVLTGVEAPQAAPFTDDPHGALASLARIEDLDVDWVLPGHGTPWQGGARALVAAIRAGAAG